MLILKIKTCLHATMLTKPEPGTLCTHLTVLSYVIFRLQHTYGQTWVCVLFQLRQKPLRLFLGPVCHAHATLKYLGFYNCDLCANATTAWVVRHLTQWRKEEGTCPAATKFRLLFCNYMIDLIRCVSWSDAGQPGHLSAYPSASQNGAGTAVLQGGVIQPFCDFLNWTHYCRTGLFLGVRVKKISASGTHAWKSFHF